MKIINQPLLNRSDKFFKSLTKNDRIALFHDTDPDGITSAKIITTALNQLGCKIVLYLSNQNKLHYIPDDKISLLKQHNINKLITTDKTVDSAPENIKKIEQFAEICVFDHHIIEHDISSKKTIFLKPQLIFDTKRPDRYCSAKFSYDILSRVANLESVDWICISGIIGDMAFPMWPAFIKKVFQKYHLKQEKDLFKTKLGLITELISFAEALGESDQCRNIILNANSIDETIQNLSKYHKVKQEVDYYIDNLPKVGQWYNHKNLLIIEVTSPSHIKSMLSSKVAHSLFPHKTVIVTQQVGDLMTISGRRNDCKIGMNILLKKSLGNIHGNAGGHAPASGASMSLKDYPQFKQNLIKYEQELRTKNSSTSN